jgi:sulfonate transport system substrate-binding protein
MTTLAPRASRRAVLGGLALAFAAVFSLPLQAQDKPEVIRIGTTAPGHLKFVLFQHLGNLEAEFAKDGIAVEFIPFTGGGSEVVTALASGAIEFAYNGNNPALRVASQNVGVKLIGLSSWVRSGGSSIIVGKDSPLRELEDLKGARIAYLTGTVRHSSLVKALKTVGLTTDDIESFNLPFEASGPALVRGDIDAIVESDNTAARLIEAGEARILLDGNAYPEWSVPHAISVNGAFLEKYPDLVKRLLTVDLATSRWADDNFDETIRAFVDFTDSSEEATRANYADGRFHQDPRITPEALASLKAEAAFMAQAGLLAGEIDYDTWVHDEIIEAVYAEKPDD